MFTYLSGSRSLAIARAGLMQVHPEAGEGAAELVAAVLAMVNDGSRKALTLQIDGAEDVSWTDVLVRTLSMAIYEETRKAGYFGLPNAAEEYIEVDSFGCSVGGHQRYDGFHARATDTIWRRVQPPFDWLCGCSTIYLPLPAKPRDPQKVLRASSILAKWSARWTVNPLAKAVPYL